jgi:hypothetical protein
LPAAMIVAMADWLRGATKCRHERAGNIQRNSEQRLACCLASRNDSLHGRLAAADTAAVESMGRQHKSQRRLDKLTAAWLRYPVNLWFCCLTSAAALRMAMRADAGRGCRSQAASTAHHQLDTCYKHVMVHLHIQACSCTGCCAVAGSLLLYSCWPGAARWQVRL